jgi:spore coat protein A, manganese oxidase
MLSAALMLPQAMRNRHMPPVRPLINPNLLAQFVDPLPVPEIARTTELRPSPTDLTTKLPYYRLAMRQIESKVHRDVKPTRLWGFGSSSPGPTLETRSGEGLLVEWANELPASHFLPIDHNIHGAEADKPDVRAVIHLHGAKAPAESDGYPENWYVPGNPIQRLHGFPNFSATPPW